MNEDEIGKLVIDASMRVHSALGAGLLETIYETCLAHELEKQGLTVKKQAALPIVYDDLRVDNAFRIDLLVDDKVVVELKAIEALAPIHTAQVISYLKTTGCQLGLLINFNT